MVIDVVLDAVIDLVRDAAKRWPAAPGGKDWHREASVAPGLRAWARRWP